MWAWICKHVSALPLALLLPLDAAAWAFSANGWVLRSAPSEVLFWLNLLAVLVLAGGLGWKLTKWCAARNLWLRILAGVVDVALAAGGLLLCGACFLGSAFSYQPEHVVEKNGQVMVACVNSFLDVYVDYYPYKNALFRGVDSLGQEWYGSGGYDPFTTEMEVSPKRSDFE